MSIWDRLYKKKKDDRLVIITIYKTGDIIRAPCSYLYDLVPTESDNVGKKYILKASKLKFIYQIYRKNENTINISKDIARAIVTHAMEETTALKAEGVLKKVDALFKDLLKNDYYFD